MEFGMLTNRESACLQHLVDGLKPKHAALALGISISTFYIHLSKARLKLEANTTSEAVAKFARYANCAGTFDSHTRPQLYDACTLQPDYPYIQSDESYVINNSDQYVEQWVDSGYHGLHSKASLWVYFCKRLQAQGFKQINLGIVAEPPGSFTNGAKLVLTTLPDDFLRLYESVGGAQADALARYTSQSTHPLYITESYGSFRFAESSKQMREFSEYWYDTYMRPCLIVPRRDAATGAPYAVVASLDIQLARDYHRHKNAILCKLEIEVQNFWNAIQNYRCLSEIPSLTPKQKAALRYLSQGLTTVQIADKTITSVRNTEKILSNARRALGVKSSAAAVYRAMVYRAL